MATLLLSSTTQAARTEPRPTSAITEKTTEPTAGKTQIQPDRTSREARESAYDKLDLENKLTIERPVPETPVLAEQALEPVPEQDQEPENRLQAVATNVPVLPGTTRETPPQEAPEAKAPAPDPPEAPPPAPARVPKPSDTRLLLTVPRLSIADVTVGDFPEQSYLNREGIMHLSGTGFPFNRGSSNTYIAGHAGDYDKSRVPNIFRNLKALRQEDLISLRDANGKAYNYRVYERLAVNPRDVWVKEPVAGKKVVSLQTCFPAPTY